MRMKTSKRYYWWCVSILQPPDVYQLDKQRAVWIFETLAFLIFMKIAGRRRVEVLYLTYSVTAY